MAYFGLVTKLHNYRKDENSERLWLADCFGEGVIVGSDIAEGELVLYLPTDGQIERWFGDTFKLFRKNIDGTEQGGYVENSGHVRAVKLRGNQSSGIVIPYKRIVEQFGELGWKDGDQVTEINGKMFCCKYIPKRKVPAATGGKKGYKGRKTAGIIYPEFSMHTDTAQLAYNLNQFQPGDIVSISLKLHGTSQRSMRTYAQLPNNWFRKLFRLKPKIKEAYVCGTRRTVVTEDNGGFYGSNAFRFNHHKRIESFVKPNMEVFYEVVGYYGVGEADTIMSIGDNTKVNDKAFVKQFGKHTIFNYGCQPGESEMYIYRITAENGAREYTPAEIIEWCEKAGVKHVPFLTEFIYEDEKQLTSWIDNYFSDLADPIGKTHVKEGVVVRILNRRTFTAYKNKTWEFRVIEGIAKASSDTPDMEEAEDA